MQNNEQTAPKKALIHKVNGDFVGVFVYKNNNPNGEVQPITLRKDNVSKFYYKLLDVLPPTYKGKNPIGYILDTYADTQDVYPLNQAMESIVIKAEFLQEADEDSFLAPGQKLSSRAIPSDVKIPDHISDDDLFKLNDSLKSTEDMDDLAKLFPNHTANLQNKFQTDSNGLRKLLKVTEIAKSSWGPNWAKQLHQALNKKVSASGETKVKTPVAVPIEKPKRTKTTKIPYLGSTGTHKLDTKYLSKALPLTINKNLDTLPEENPKLVKDLYDNLGEHWKSVLTLARKAKVSSLMNQSQDTWKQALASDYGSENSELVSLPNFHELADGIYNAAKTANVSPEAEAPKILPPADPEKTAHYHDDGKKYPFNPMDVKNALIKLDNMNPLAVVNRAPNLHKVLQAKFGPNWGVLLSVAQRLTRYKATNIPDPIGKVRSEYKGSMERAFGPDWENNFGQIVNSLDDKALITQADPSIAEKEKAQNVQVSYQNKDQVASPDLKYLKDIALPSLIGKTDGYIATLDEEDPNLALELQTKLGPSWKTLVTLSKVASKSVSNKEDPYVKIINLIQNNPVFGSNLEKTLGPGFLDIVNKVVQGTTGVKPPRDLNIQAPTDPSNPTQSPAPEQDPNMQAPAAQDGATAQPQPDPGAAQDPNQVPVQTDPNASQDPNAQAPIDPNQPQIADPAEAQPQELTEPTGSPTLDPTVPDNINPDATIGNTGIQGDGSVPQSKNNNKELDKEPVPDKPLTVSLPEPEPSPTGDLKYIDSTGKFRKLAVGSIIQALEIDEIDDPKKARAAFDLLGKDYEQLYAYIHMGQHLISRGKDPAEIWKKQNELPSNATSRSKRLGPDFDTVMDTIAEILKQVDAAKKQQLAAQQPEVPPIGQNPVAPTEQPQVPQQ